MILNLLRSQYIKRSSDGIGILEIVLLCASISLRFSFNNSCTRFMIFLKETDLVMSAQHSVQLWNQLNVSLQSALQHWSCRDDKAELPVQHSLEPYLCADPIRHVRSTSQSEHFPL